MSEIQRWEMGLHIRPNGEPPQLINQPSPEGDICLYSDVQALLDKHAAEIARLRRVEKAAAETIKLANALCGSCISQLHPNDFGIGWLQAAIDGKTTAYDAAKSGAGEGVK